MKDFRIQRFADFLVDLGNGDRELFTRGLPKWLVEEALNLVPERRAFLQRQRDAELFDAQIKRLNERMREKQLVQMLEAQKPAVLARAAKLEHDPATFLRFLPVIPMSHCTVISQMAMVEWNGKQGIVGRGMHPRIFHDYADAPENPYYAYDVRFVHRNQFDPEEFEYMGTSEVIDFCVHADTLHFPFGAHELCALRPIVSETEGSLVASILFGSSVPKLDLISRDAIPSDSLVLVKRKL